MKLDQYHVLFSKLDENKPKENYIASLWRNALTIFIHVVLPDNTEFLISNDIPTFYNSLDISRKSSSILA